MPLAYEIARGLAEGALDALIEKGPQLLALLRATNTTEMKDVSPVPTEIVEGLNKEIADAQRP